jgi:hypothetical protein
MNKYSVISIEPTGLANYWVITYKNSKGITDKESIEAHDSNAAFIKFRNQRIEELKAKVIRKPEQ